MSRGFVDDGRGNGGMAPPDPVRTLEGVPGFADAVEEDAGTLEDPLGTAAAEGAAGLTSLTTGAATICGVAAPEAGVTGWACSKAGEAVSAMAPENAKQPKTRKNLIRTSYPSQKMIA